MDVLDITLIFLLLGGCLQKKILHGVSLIAGPLYNTHKIYHVVQTVAHNIVIYLYEYIDPIGHVKTDLR